MRREENPRQLLQSVIRAFRIAEMLAEEGELGVTEIDGRLGIDKSTAYRILATLREMGYVRQNPLNSKYSNTPKFSFSGERLRICSRSVNGPGRCCAPCPKGWARR